MLWGWLLKQGVKINFAHRTFAWSNEARGKAAVHCVIVGFALEDAPEKVLFEYENVTGDAHASRVDNISPYLTGTASTLIEKRMKPLSRVPEIVFGSKAVDFGHFVIDQNEIDAFLAAEPTARPYIREYIGSEEFLNGSKRFCLWLKGIAPQTLRTMPKVLERVDAVRQERSRSAKAPTRELARTPAEFGEDRQPSTPYLLIPKVSSENRIYVPLGFFPPDVIINPSVLVVPNASLYEFGVLQSVMHMAWMRAVCGRLESRYQYSATIVYNNFPWPAPTDKQRAAIEAAAQSVLDARAAHPGASLADLYDPLTMPPDLVRAHQKLDAAVDAAYGYKGATTDAARVAFLFALYQQLTSLLPADDAKPRRKRRPASADF